ncbi:MAG: M1 family aminopeptidase [Bacteroidota bacterium]|nr:M1 family aminopeptidase [Bacteroidota bacterium]
MCFALVVLCATLGQAAFAESALIDVVRYRAVLRFDIDARMLHGQADVSMRNAARGSLDEITLDLVDMDILGVEVGGTSAVYSYDDALLRVTLPASLPPGDTVAVRVLYEGQPGNEGGVLPWGGCHWGEVTYFMGVGFTAPEVSMMRRWLPSNDIPSDKATFDVTFEVPEGLVVAGTGLLADRPIAPAGYTAYRWVENHPTATYLFTYAISDYVVVEDSWNGVPMQYYVPRADSVRAVSYFSTVPSMMDAFTARFGDYPFDKVGYCITPIGSMEHQTMISYAAQLFTGLQEAGSTAAHELAHMWWGDLVTCRDFGDAWLNEGFAVFSEMIYAEHLGGEQAYLENLRETAQRYRINDARSEGVFPLHDFPRARPSSNYPATIYHKGGVVMAMLRDVMGDSAFFEGLRAYAARHAYDNASTEDLQDVMEEYHGSELDWFFQPWVYAAGWPEYVIQRVLEDDGGVPLRLRLLQTQDSTQFPLYAMPMDVMIVTNDGDTVRQRLDTKAVSFQEFTFNDVATGDVRNFYMDPRGIILKKISYRTVDVAALTPAPRSVRLGAGYPQPYRPGRDGVAVLPVTAAAGASAVIAVHDALGRRVATLHDGMLPEGNMFLRFDGHGLPPGMYFILLRSGVHSEVQRLIIE